MIGTFHMQYQLTHKLFDPLTFEVLKKPHLNQATFGQEIEDIPKKFIHSKKYYLMIY